MVKRILKSEAVRSLVAWLAAAYIELVWTTGRWRVENGDVPRRFWDHGRPFVIAFWHNQILMTVKCWDYRRPIRMLASEHGDGQLVGRVIERFGVKLAIGSTTRGGSVGLRHMVRALKAGECVGLTPDGPRGPRMRAQPGVVSLAQLGGVPIVPLGCSFRPRRLAGSWDRFQIAFPFGRGVFVWGEPIDVPRDLDAAAFEAKRLEVETAMTALLHRAEALMGYSPMPPASPAEPVPAGKRSDTVEEEQA